MLKNNKLTKVLAMLICIMMLGIIVPANAAYADTASVTTQLTVTSASDYEYNSLKWPTNENADYYEVMRAKLKDGKIGTYGCIETIRTSKATATFKDYEFYDGDTYYYKIAMYDANENKLGESNVVKVVIKLEKPLVIGHNLISNGYAYLKWDDISGASRYQIWRSPSKNGTYTKIITTTNNTHTVKKATLGKIYYYKVKAIRDGNSAANSAFSSKIALKRVKVDTALKKAVNNTPEKKVATLDNTLSIVSKLGIKNLTGFDGGIYHCFEGNLTLGQIYNFSKIKNAGGIVKKTQSGYGDPFFGAMMVYPQKNNVKYEEFEIRTYGINTFTVKKGSSKDKIIKSIKNTAYKYYPSSKWTVTVDKYDSSKSKFKGDVNNHKEIYNHYVKSSGYGKYISNKYVLTIKNKSNKTKKGWAFVTVVPK